MVAQPKRELLAAPRREGRPVGLIRERVDRTCSLWFCYESCNELSLLGELTRLLGFCPEHAAYAPLPGRGHSPLALRRGAMLERLVHFQAAGAPES